MEMTDRELTVRAETDALTTEAVAVAPQEIRRLAECCAFFKAGKYRAAEPGTIRKSDVKSAEEEIAGIIRDACKGR